MSLCRLPPDIASAGTARRFVREALATDDVGEEARFVAELLATELVTNAVRHARSPVDLRVALRAGRIRVEARDASTRRPVAPAVDTPTRHRGVLLIEDLSDDWGVEVDDGRGKVVWCEVGAAASLPG